MEEEKAKRVRRSPEQIAEDLDLKIVDIQNQIKGIEENRATANAKYDAKIADAKAKIKTLSEKKAALLAPKKPRAKRKTKKQKFQEIIKQAEKAGLKPEDIAEKLGITFE